jgi:N-acetylglucosamine kinase-like BadF-type ATPase
VTGPFFLGCDGGGTKTDLVVITGEGRLAGYLRAPGTYYLSSRTRGTELVRDVLGEAVPAVCARAGIAPGDVRFAFFGLPGYGEVPADGPALDAAAAQALRHRRFRCDNDMVCGWAGSLAGADGINVIAGTGSMTYGRRAGADVRVGGWGELFGDEGSGYWIGIQALRAFAKMSDGRAQRGPLHDVLRRALALDADTDLIGLVLRQWQGARQRIAALAPAVRVAASSGDGCAQAILTAAAAELTGLVDAARRRLGFTSGEVVPVSYSGGIFAIPEILDSFLAGISALPVTYRVSRPRYAPVIGAALYAATLAGAPLDAAARQALPAAGDYPGAVSLGRDRRGTRCSPRYSARRSARRLSPSAVTRPARARPAMTSKATVAAISGPPRTGRPWYGAGRSRGGARSSRPLPETAAEQVLHISAPVPGPSGSVADFGQQPPPCPFGHRL